MDNLKRLAEQFQNQAPAAAAAQEDDDNDAPELVAGETFQSAAKGDNFSRASDGVCKIYIFLPMISILQLLPP